jgi:hypothetical protein
MATAKKQKGATKRSDAAVVPRKKPRADSLEARQAAKVKAKKARAEAWREAQQEIFAQQPPPANRTVVHGATPKPTKYDAELGKRICLMFATDPEMNLLKMNSDPELPTVWHFYEWLRDHNDFEKLYARAREIQGDLQAAELEVMAATPMLGTITVQRTGGKDGATTETRTHDNVDRTRLRVDTRKWLLSKLRPKKYGLQPIEVEGNDALQELLGAFRQRSTELE